MELHDAVDALIAACRAANADPELLFEHFDRDDSDSYREALEQGWIPAASLPRWMACTAQTILEGRCLCRKCKAVRT